jgi:hypothetical protein
MKTIIMVITVVGVMALAVQFNYPKDSYEYVREEGEATLEVVEPVEPAIPSEWLQEAEAAKASVLRRKALEKERADLDAEIKASQARIKAIDAEIIEVMKKSTSY